MQAINRVESDDVYGEDEYIYGEDWPDPGGRQSICGAVA